MHCLMRLPSRTPNAPPHVPPMLHASCAALLATSCAAPCAASRAAHAGRRLVLRAKRLHGVCDLANRVDHDLVVAHGAAPLGCEDTDEHARARREVALGALRPVGERDALPCREVKRNDVLTADTLQLGLWPRHLAKRAWRHDFLCLLRLLVRFAHHELDLLLVLHCDLVPVLWPHEHAGVLVRRLFEAGAVALDNGRREDWHHVFGEL
mmetsp:Transcript_38192/g.113171  ORF Transcript_38192/g.113171 Transcript_38192/m.113171 type:complete len:209 (-) Transcript_38192:659-1285(-)